MKTLVIGYGSIGERHARLLSQEGHDTAVVTKRDIDFEKYYHSVEQALEKENPGYIVVCSQTSSHYTVLSELARLGYEGRVLVEKPLFDELKPVPENNFKDLFVGYNLRFHPLVQKARDLLKNEPVISVCACVGQYLPQWRPGRDYTKTSSADIKSGGGVLRDLSHELDYLNWILGGWQSLCALKGHFSGLDISSDDVCSILMVTKNCPAVTINLNYLDRAPRRVIVFNTNENTIKLDLIKGVLQVNENARTMQVDIDDTYRLQHRAVLNIDTEHREKLCSAEDALEVMKIINAVEQASDKKVWVNR